MKIWLIGISLTALFGFFSIFGWFSDKVDKKADKTEVKEVEVKVEKTKDEIVEGKLIDMKQSILMERNTQLIEKLDIKLDKALAE